MKRFDRFVIDFKSTTRYHIPDKGLRVLDEDGIVITDPCRPGFKRGEKVKEEFWGKSTDDKLRFLYDSSEYNVYQLMKNFFFEHNTIINTKTKTKVLTFMHMGFFLEFHVDRNPNTQKDVVLIEGVVPPLRTHVKHGTTIETILHLRIVATLI